MSPCRVLGISGSLRATSFNTALLRAAVDAAPEGMQIDVYEGLRELPFYDGDLDHPERRPAPVLELRRLVEQADGLLLVTPEYSFSMPGVLKNALDWLASSPATPADPRLLKGKPVAITGASPGAFGTIRAQHALRQVMFDVEAAPVIRPEVAVYSCHQRFDADGRLTDATTAGLLGDLMRALGETIARQRDDHQIGALAGAGVEREAS